METKRMEAKNRGQIPMKGQRKENRNGGYFTVEAAMLLPFVFMVILFVMYTLYFWHDRAMMEMDTAIMLVNASQLRGTPADKIPYLESTARERYKEDYIWLRFSYARFLADEHYIEAHVENAFVFQGHDLAVNREWKIQATNPVFTLRNMLKLRKAPEKEE